MAKYIYIFPELMFLEPLPELHPDFIEKIKKKREHQNKKK